MSLCIYSCEESNVRECCATFSRFWQGHPSIIESINSCRILSRQKNNVYNFHYYYYQRVNNVPYLWRSRAKHRKKKKTNVFTFSE